MGHKWRERKKLQRYANHSIKALNKAIAKDTLWKGRFIARQTNARYEAEDNSLAIWITLYDKKSGKSIGFWNDMGNYSIDRPFFDSYLFLEMKRFVIEDCNAWVDDLKNDETDYTKVKINF